MSTDTETINCRLRHEGCLHDQPVTAAGMDPEGEGMKEDGTWDGETVVCDVCYMAIGGISFNPNPGLIGGGAGRPPEFAGERLTVEEAIEALSVSDAENDRRVVHTARVGGPAFLGADWDLADLEELIRRFHATKLFSPVMGHQLLVIDETGPLVIEARES